MDLDRLSTNHKEADTRMTSYAKHISQRNNSNVVIHTLGTDFFNISLATTHKINPNLFNCTVRLKKIQIISVFKLKELLALHGFTVCDTVSGFSGKEKIKPLSYC